MWNAKYELPHDRKPDGWFISASLHIIFICALIVIQPGTKTPEPYTRIVAMPLVYVPPAPHTPLEAPPVRVRRELPPVIRPKAAPPEIETPAPPPPPKEIAKQMTAPIPVQHPKPASIAAPDPAPQLALAQTPIQTADLKTPNLPGRPAPPVKTGVFDTAGQSTNGHTPSPRLEVQTGGFDALRGSGGLAAKGASSGSVHLGGFGDSNSGSVGHGSAGGQVVASAGFGNGAERTASNPTHRATSAPSETPVEVLWKPKPAYTAEAREKKLEGAVTLEVVFHASGQVQVLRVVHGLGAGLDESARDAAQQIRFRPGKKDGVPVDRTGLVQITFELS
ncbi:MAG TPA: TonB family protein [Bryobacteraceae bacterium]|nr:TonB family protein [Bryobacteraceae bacterium]